MSLCSRFIVSAPVASLLARLARTTRLTARPRNSEENAAARAKKQRGPGLPAQSSIRLRRSWDEAGARSETVSSRRSRSLSSGMPSAPVTSFAPIEPYTPYHRQQSSGLTRTVDSLHISEMPYGFEAAPFPSSMSSYSSSESPVEPHFPHLLPVSWSPHMQPAYSSASYPPHHLPTPHQSGQSSRPSSSGVPFPQHLATDLTAHRYVAWDRPTPPSEVTSPRTSEPETFAYTAYAPPSHRQPPPPRQQPSRPRLHHSLSLPVGSSDGQYSQLVAHEYTYHHPPYAEDGRRHFSHTAHASSVTQERQANIEAYFSNQGHPQMYRTRYEDGYDVQQQPHDGRRLSDNFSPDMSFTPAHELLATPSMMDRSLSPGDATIGGKEWSRRPSAGMGLGVPLPEVMTDEFGFKYAPTW